MKKLVSEAVWRILGYLQKFRLYRTFHVTPSLRWPLDLYRLPLPDRFETPENPPQGARDAPESTSSEYPSLLGGADQAGSAVHAGRVAGLLDLLCP